MKFISFFNEKNLLGNTDKLGGKGAGLKYMTRLGLPVPPGLTLTTDAWQLINKENKIPKEIEKEIIEGIVKLENKLGRQFAKGENPFFVSVRSGAKYSMPGMMDTILNIGMGKYDENPYQQLFNSIISICNSWNNPSAVAYRQQYGISDDLGTAITVHVMVFGNKKDSGSGVVFTRNPNTGENGLYGDFGIMMQGEEIVAGEKKLKTLNMNDFSKIFPAQFKELFRYAKLLEKKLKDIQDIEFTIEEGKLWLLQTRNAKRTSLANVKINYDLYKEGVIFKTECLDRISENDIDLLTRPKFDPDAEMKMIDDKIIGVGSMACPGNISGKLVLSIDHAEKLIEKGEKVIIVDEYLDPNDISVISKASGIVTLKGTPSSHIALILRSIGIPAIVGCTGLQISKALTSHKYGRKVLMKEGDDISINADLGNVYLGKIELTETPHLPSELHEIIKEKVNFVGRSGWTEGLYDEENAPSLKKVTSMVDKVLKLSRKTWKSPKAHVIELLNYIFSDDIFCYKSKLYKPDDVKGIISSAKELFKQKYVSFFRTCYNPHPLSSTPYSSEISDEQTLNDFLNNADFPGKYGGYPKWLEDKRLEAIEVVLDQPDKLNPTQYDKHFACTISCRNTITPTLEINLSLGNPHLREFENISKRELITISFALGKQYKYNLGNVSYQIGAKFFDEEKLRVVYKSSQLKVANEKKTSYNDFRTNIEDQIDRNSLPDLIYRSLIRTDVLHLIDLTVERISEMWKPPYYLPYKMAALDNALDLGILEAQGRFENGKLIWFKIYGAKGAEENARR